MRSLLPGLQAGGVEVQRPRLPTDPPILLAGEYQQLATQRQLGSGFASGGKFWLSTTPGPTGRVRSYDPTTDTYSESGGDEGDDVGEGGDEDGTQYTSAMAIAAAEAAIAGAGWPADPGPGADALTLANGVGWSRTSAVAYYQTENDDFDPDSTIVEQHNTGGVGNGGGIYLARGRVRYTLHLDKPHLEATGDYAATYRTHDYFWNRTDYADPTTNPPEGDQSLLLSDDLTIAFSPAVGATSAGPSEWINLALPALGHTVQIIGGTWTPKIVVMIAPTEEDDTEEATAISNDHKRGFLNAVHAYGSGQPKVYRRETASGGGNGHSYSGSQYAPDEPTPGALTSDFSDDVPDEAKSAAVPNARSMRAAQGLFPTQTITSALRILTRGSGADTLEMELTDEDQTPHLTARVAAGMSDPAAQIAADVAWEEYENYPVAVNWLSPSELHCAQQRTKYFVKLQSPVPGVEPSAPIEPDVVSPLYPGLAQSLTVTWDEVTRSLVDDSAPAPDDQSFAVSIPAAGFSELTSERHALPVPTLNTIVRLANFAIDPVTNPCHVGVLARPVGV